MTTCKCDNCNWTGDEADLRCTTAETPHLKLRVDAGATVPAGECPACGCLAYLIDEGMGTYTVMLLRPDYVTGGDLETFLTNAKADTPQQAVDAARLEAMAADNVEEGNATDYAVLFICAGKHDDLTHLIDNEEEK